MRRACERARIDRRAAYHARDDDKEFAAAWDEALEEACDLLESEAVRRGRDGVTKPVFYQGDIAGYIQDYSDTLLMFLLRAHRPAKFSERIRQDSVALNVDVSKLTDEQLERIAKGEDVRAVFATASTSRDGTAETAESASPPDNAA